MKFKKTLMVLIIIITIFNVNAYATPHYKYQPHADVYKEGIYHFQKSIGNKMTFTLLTPDKCMNIVIIENNDIKYYIQLNEKSLKTEIFLEKPLKVHTSILIGDGEMSFTFEW